MGTEFKSAPHISSFWDWQLPRACSCHGRRWQFRSMSHHASTLKASVHDIFAHIPLAMEPKVQNQCHIVKFKINKAGKLFSSHGARERVNIRRKIHSLMSKGHQISKRISFYYTEQQDLVWKWYKYTTEKNNSSRTHNAGSTGWFPTNVLYYKRP